jgi:DNA-binding transcriptional regulator YiaG
MQPRVICTTPVSSTNAECASMHALCLVPVPSYSSRRVRALRAHHKLNQAVPASVLNTSLSTVRQREMGE